MVQPDLFTLTSATAFKLVSNKLVFYFLNIVDIDIAVDIE